MLLSAGSSAISSDVRKSLGRYSSSSCVPRRVRFRKVPSRAAAVDDALTKWYAAGGTGKRIAGSVGCRVAAFRRRRGRFRGGGGRDGKGADTMETRWKHWRNGKDVDVGEVVQEDLLRLWKKMKKEEDRR